MLSQLLDAGSPDGIVVVQTGGRASRKAATPILCRASTDAKQRPNTGDFKGA
jgi:hypothetical protein